MNLETKKNSIIQMLATIRESATTYTYLNGININYLRLVV